MALQCEFWICHFWPYIISMAHMALHAKMASLWLLSWPPMLLESKYCSNWQPWILKSKAKPPSAAMVPKQLQSHMPCLWNMMAASGWSSGPPTTPSTNYSLGKAGPMLPFPTTQDSKISLQGGTKNGPRQMSPLTPCLKISQLNLSPKREKPQMTQRLWKCHCVAPTFNAWCKAKGQPKAMWWSNWKKTSWSHFSFFSRTNRRAWTPGSHTRGARQQPKNQSKAQFARLACWR